MLPRSNAPVSAAADFGLTVALSLDDSVASVPCWRADADFRLFDKLRLIVRQRIIPRRSSEPRDWVFVRRRRNCGRSRSLKRLIEAIEEPGTRLNR